MQELLEVIRITISQETGIVEKTHKAIEWRDVVGLEEADAATLAETEERELVLISLTYADILVVDDYFKLLKKWKKYKENSKNDLNNFGKLN
tara:strand:- start:407 stop:682 length:276 start_codon:yes stop_codon:yes gene_type:complete